MSFATRQTGERRRSERRGFISTIELLFVLPLMLVAGLVVFQFILIHMAYQRVQTAAIEGACLAAQGNDMDDVEDVVGLALGFMAAGPGPGHLLSTDLEGFELTRQIIDTDAVPGVSVGDTVEVSVRIPMKRASTNYLGLLGGSVDLLHIRSVVKKRLLAEPPDP